MVFSGLTYQLSKCSSFRFFFWNVLFMRNCYDVFGRSNYSTFDSSVVKKSSEEAPWRIIFFGSDEFSLTSLKPLTAKLRTGTLMSELGVVSGSGTVVHKFAVAENLTIHEWPPSHEVLQNYDLGMVVAYGKLIPDKIIKALPLGVLNVHGSLLPRWRGAAPIEHAIMNGDTETGVTIFRIKPHKFDIGDIVRQYRCSIAPNETAAEIRLKLAAYGAKLLLECVRDLPRSVDMATPQSNEGVTYAPKLNSSLAVVDWSQLTAQQVYNRHRALAHIYPLTSVWYGRPVKLHDIALAREEKPPKGKQHSSTTTTSSCKSALDFLNNVSNSDSAANTKGRHSKNISPGRIKYSHKQKVLNIECADGSFVTCNRLRVLQRPMSATDFFNGFLTKQSESNWIFGIQDRESFG